jgi:hypothetical protein
MSKIYEVVVKVEDHVSGNKSHGAIYPAFSRSVPQIKRIEEIGEDIQEVSYNVLSIQDGTFLRASRIAGYTGQHTDLDIPKTAEYLYGGELITWKQKSPYINGSLFSRNKYGSTVRKFRLNMESRKLEHSIRRGEKVSWISFQPANYLD